jgi:hypothetical protein
VVRHDDEIRVAVLNGFNGQGADLAIPAADGMGAYFNMVTEVDGVCGRIIVSTAATRCGGDSVLS